MIDEGGSVRFETVRNRKAKTLPKVIERNVEPGSIIHTDEWRAYNGLKELMHETGNHSVNFVSHDGIHTQRTESQWRQMRRRFSAGGIRHEDIQSYLEECVWRRSCKLRGEDAFDPLMRVIRGKKGKK